MGKVMSLCFNMLSRFIIAFLPRRKCLLISCLQSQSAVILEPKKIKFASLSKVISHTVEWKYLFSHLYATLRQWEPLSKTFKLSIKKERDKQKTQQVDATKWRSREDTTDIVGDAPWVQSPRGCNLGPVNLHCILKTLQQDLYPLRVMVFVATLSGHLSCVFYSPGKKVIAYRCPHGLSLVSGWNHVD